MMIVLATLIVAATGPSTCLEPRPDSRLMPSPTPHPSEVEAVSIEHDERDAPEPTDPLSRAEWVVLDGVRTRLVRCGHAGRPVVLIHGFGSNLFTWRRSLIRLSASSEVFALDLKGFGLTDKPSDGRYNTQVYSEQVLDLLDHYELDRVVLVGHSMGGAVAIRLALEHPERIAGLVLVGSALPRGLGQIDRLEPHGLTPKTDDESGLVDVEENDHEGKGDKSRANLARPDPAPWD